jgi:hypothetical protein
LSDTTTTPHLPQETKDAVTKLIAQVITETIKDTPMPTGAKRAVWGTMGGLAILATTIITWGNNITERLTRQEVTQAPVAAEVPKLKDRVLSIEVVNAARDAREIDRDRRLERMETSLSEISRAVKR